MSIFETLNNMFGKRPTDDPPAPGYEHFGGEPVDPRNSRYWRSIPHPGRIAIPTMADYLIEVVNRVRAHKEGIDDATGPFLFKQIETEAEAIGVAIEERYLDQVRTEQGLWADEDTIAFQHEQEARILKTQLGIADSDYRGGRDALLGEPGATPAWDKGVTGERRTPVLPVPGLPAPRPLPASDAMDPGPAATSSPAAPEDRAGYTDAMSPAGAGPVPGSVDATDPGRAAEPGEKAA